MPSPRKRIGFLPGVEVQEIIDSICNEKGLSQSKVTGLLVEEALKKRGLYEPKIGKKEFVDNLTEVVFSDFYSNKNKDSDIFEDNKVLPNKNILNKNKSNEMLFSKDEFELLKDYIEFKRFKSMMRRIDNEKIGWLKKN